MQNRTSEGSEFQLLIVSVMLQSKLHVYVVSGHTGLTGLSTCTCADLSVSQMLSFVKCM